MFIMFVKHLYTQGCALTHGPRLSEIQRWPEILVKESVNKLWNFLRSVWGSGSDQKHPKGGRGMDIFCNNTLHHKKCNVIMPKFKPNLDNFMIIKSRFSQLKCTFCSIQIHEDFCFVI